MSLARGPEIHVYAEMDLHAPVLEPDTSALRELGRLHDLRKPEEIRIESPRLVFAAALGETRAVEGAEPGQLRRHDRSNLILRQRLLEAAREFQCLCIERPAKLEEGVRLRALASPLGIVGTPRDIALAVLYLASDASRFMTGQILRPNGGVAMP